MLPLSKDTLRDALSQLSEWIGDATEIHRSMRLDDSEHAAFTERLKVVADALQLRPDVRRLDGYTQVRVRSCDGGTLTTREVALAARIDVAYRAVTDPMT